MKDNILISRLFIISLILLLLNDFLLKDLFHNTITGKLSDFAGLFIFPLVGWHLFGRKKAIYVFTFIFFIFWKTPLSEPFINLWNSFFWYKLSRVIDYSDLIALSILPVSYYYTPKPPRIGTFVKYCRICILFFSCFSFIATAGTQGRLEKVYFSNSKKEVYTAMLALLNAYPELKAPDSLLKQPIQIVPLNEYKKGNKEIIADSINFNFYTPENKRAPVIWCKFSGGNTDWKEKGCYLILVAVSNKYGNKLYEKELNDNEEKMIKVLFQEKVVSKLDSILKKKQQR